MIAARRQVLKWHPSLDDFEFCEFDQQYFLSSISELDGDLEVLPPTLHFHHISNAEALVLYDTSLTEPTRRW